MSNQQLTWNTLFEEIIKYKEEFLRLEDLITKNDAVLEDKIKSQYQELKKLNEELQYSNEITDKTKEDFLLEFKSVLDKQKLEINRQNKLLNENSKKFDSITQQMDSKESYSIELKKEIELLSECISDKNIQMKKLKNQLKDSKNKITLKEKELKKIEITKNNEINTLNNQIDEITSQMNLKEEKLHNLEITKNKYQELVEIKSKEIDNIKYQLKTRIIELKAKNNEINTLEIQLKNKNKNLEIRKNNEINALNNQIDEITSQMNLKEEKLHNLEITKNKYQELVEIKSKEIDNIKYQLKTRIVELKAKNNEINTLEIQLKNKNTKLQTINNDYIFIQNRIQFYEEKIQNNNLEIEYLKNDYNIIKKFIAPLAYFVIIFKSKSNEIKTNIQLYKTLKNNKCFDIGYYLNKYPDITESKWCNYFSPELHFVCRGFNENRKINKNILKYSNKAELIDYIKNSCNL